MDFLVQHIDPQNDEQNGSSADKYCVCENYQVIVGEYQNTLTEVAAIVQANATWL